METPARSCSSRPLPSCGRRAHFQLSFLPRWPSLNYPHSFSALQDDCLSSFALFDSNVIDPRFVGGIPSAQRPFIFLRQPLSKDTQVCEDIVRKRIQYLDSFCEIGKKR